MQFIRSQVPRESGPVPQARSCLGLAVCRCWTGWQLNLFQFCSWLSTVLTTRRCGFDSREKPWRCLHRHLMGRKPPAPAHRSDGARPWNLAARDTVPSAGGLRTACVARNCVQPSTAGKVRALQVQRGRHPPDRATAARQALAAAVSAACPFEGLDRMTVW